MRRMSQPTRPQRIAITPKFQSSGGNGGASASPSAASALIVVMLASARHVLLDVHVYSCRFEAFSASSKFVIVKKTRSYFNL